MSFLIADFFSCADMDIEGSAIADIKNDEEQENLRGIYLMQ